MGELARPVGAERSSQRLAMRLSLAVGLLMLAGKMGAWWLTGSSAILSDALESVVHVAAVAFAAFSLWLSLRPANTEFLYGYERINFFSAGFEGGMIVLAALLIFYTAVDQWLAGLPLRELGRGTLLVAAAAALNAALGGYLLAVGRRSGSLILEANGKHVLTDVWTSAGVIAGLALVQITGWKPFDPLCAIAVALNILWSGSHLIWRSARGLLDYSDPATGRALREHLDRLAGDLKIEYHGLRFRTTGNRLLVELHLLFPFDTPLGRAHACATQVEESLQERFDHRAEVLTHLEAIEDHGVVHRSGGPH